ncbi:EscJ/YscJ/HrcJ family type III secretion inner membrane ring protein [Trinickia dabaoshanensis]|uniref:EscJ/YscJ/HrcJ family type III secretion inner membrane ring protein n=1 Tax=Trinickia dabaoshanensis TaxID=564714 RepID=A0A2N7VTC9_9BURK|nr:EscJ/YscJ/HrcJ family type III secretion inner membrane ring protein [Trinickia dabaoshanensis]
MTVEARLSARRHEVLTSLLPIVIAAVLSGCERHVELQLAPDARRASEIAAALSSHGIAVERKTEKAGVMLSVADSDLPRAMRALREAGLSRAARPSVDEALGKRGIASTPLEERARHIHAIERALEATLMEIDGVVAARVSVVPPERPAPGAPLAAASASVLVKHSAGVDLSAVVPGIASIVKNAVPGLAVEDDRHVAVMLLAEQRTEEAHSAPSANASYLRTRRPWELMLLAGGSMAIGYLADRSLRRLRQRISNRRADNDTRRS